MIFHCMMKLFFSDVVNYFTKPRNTTIIAFCIIVDSQGT